MIHRAIPASLLGLATPMVLGAHGVSPHGGVEVTQMTVHQRIVVRVPRMTAAPPAPIRWKEHRGPKCIDVNDVAGAVVNGDDTVDLVLIGSRRMRARLERSCRQIGYYSGFYVKPGADGRVCAGRDSIRVRSGAACGISAYKRLEVKR
jgi:hypothetical protein